MSNKILIIEDYEPLYNAICDKLEKKGNECLVARTVENAQELLAEHPEINLVWLDHYLLGSQNGLDFIAALRATQKYKNLPVIVVSNEANAENVEKYQSFGISKYFVKVESKLSEIVAEVLELLE